MAKIKLKFNLNFGGEEIRTLDDLRENFSVEDVLDNFNSGTLARWLDSRNYNNELEQVKSIQATDARGILAELIRIFGVGSDPTEIEANISLVDYLEGRKKFWAEIKANGLDGTETIRALRQEIEAVKQERDNLKEKLEKAKKEINDTTRGTILLKDGSMGIRAEIPIGHLLDSGWITIKPKGKIFKIVEAGNCPGLAVADADGIHRNVKQIETAILTSGSLFDGIAVTNSGIESYKSLNKKEPLYFYYVEVL